MPSTRKQTGVRLSDEAMQLLNALSKATGLSKTGVIELAIRDFAKSREVSLQPEAKTQQRRK